MNGNSNISMTSEDDTKEGIRVDEDIKFNIEETNEEGRVRLRRLRELVEGGGDLGEALALGYTSWLANAMENVYIPEILELKEGEDADEALGRDAERTRCALIFARVVKELRDWEVGEVGRTRHDNPNGVLVRGGKVLATRRQDLGEFPFFADALGEFVEDWIDDVREYMGWTGSRCEGLKRVDRVVGEWTGRQ